MTAVTQLIAVRRYVDILSDATAVAPIKQSGRRLSVAADNGQGDTVYFPFAPPTVRHSDLGGRWNEVPRPGLDDLLLPTNSPVAKMSFTAILADNAGVNNSHSAAWIIARLADFHRYRQRVKVNYAAFESGLWYITEMDFESLQRDALTDEITHASVSLEFSRASDIVDGVGPVTGGVKPPSAPQVTPPPPQQSSARTHRVVKGDTLWDISIKFYGTGTKWKIIGDANGVKDARKLQIGTVLRIP